jgi:abequosyltransferase
VIRQEQFTVQPMLSLCIPTFNRARFLDECLDSLRSTPSEVWERIEILISDNASTDCTQEVVRKYEKEYRIRYFRNETNIGGERNFFAAAERASSDHVWVFGDDDLFNEGALARVLPYLQSGVDLIILNYSIWSKEMDKLLRPGGFTQTSDRLYTNHDDVLQAFGVHLGYISSVVVRKEVMLAASPAEREKYVPYGFPHMYSIYCGLPDRCHAACISTAVFRNRSGNCEGFIGEDAQPRWIKYFIQGTALIFEELESRGYSRAAVLGAKSRLLSESGVGSVLTAIHSIGHLELLRFMYQHYHRVRRFWTHWLPALLLPAFISHPLYSLYQRRRSRAS